MRKTAAIRKFLPFIAIFAALCILEPVVDANYEKTSLGRAGKSESAMYALAGEFRSVIANVLWIKVEKYHHEFIRTNTNWRANKEILPLVKVITDLDPHFVDAYLLGSWMLCMGMDRTNEGIEYLKEGVHNNPDNMAVHEIMGTIYARKLNQPGKALPYLRRAYQLSADDWDRKRMRRFIRSVQEMADAGVESQLRITTDKRGD
ncbi:MAG: hypothetical protein Q7N50_00135 [Armatimonadota bacterium]|nr:hypothetical protein [Armatimonadota bacterium]